MTDPDEMRPHPAPVSASLENEESKPLPGRAIDMRRNQDALSFLMNEMLERRPLDGLTAGHITPDQLKVLRLLHGRPRIRVGEVADALGIKTSSASLALDRLENKGLLLRSVDSKDRRVTRLQLTPLGTNVFEEAERAIADRLRQALEGFPEQDVEHLRALLDRLIEGLMGEEPPTTAACFHCGFDPAVADRSDTIGSRGREEISS